MAIRSGRRWWAVIGVGALACAGCCVVVPLLAAAGLAGSGALLVGAGWLEPIGFALVAVGVIGFVASRIRARRPPRQLLTGSLARCVRLRLS
ncbi:hypothetical protein [[Mycobacterium] burgundiense]|uniref:Mercuric ion transport protein n=1 Tax=[Mycobacterium] burgundiense TaxID=3064286 RepID=A0ABM9LVE8_9MYCO|nr:hypothetical protein [Mycolicibacterium sp. MU0053]CAJ1505380.1 hypothetical protein MU0053_002921 [Mycolicibacterium sp. MU0053]